MDNNQEIKKERKKSFILILAIMLIIVLISGGTMAWLNWNSESKTAISISAGGVLLTIDGGGDINSNKLAPTFECNNSNYAIQRTITASAINGTDDDMIAFIQLYTNSELFPDVYKMENLEWVISSSENDCTTSSNVLASGNFAEIDNSTDNDNKENTPLDLISFHVPANTTIPIRKTYYLYIWVNDEYVIKNYGDDITESIQDVEFTLELTGKITSDPESVSSIGSKPVLDEGMIPVTISDDGIVKTIASNDSAWYNYSNQKWANVVLVNSDSRSSYKNTTGVTVNSTDILAYYVWIPRYKYKIWTTDMSSSGNEQSIDIKFESEDALMSLGTQVGEYRTHPAFWWDDDSDSEVDRGEMLPGIWVGKFETTGDATTPTIKPNQSSLVSQNVSTQFTTSLKFAGGEMDTTTGEVTFAGNDEYGLTDKMDSHMMKNSEWGAVAYLSRSQYGINEEVRINNYYNSGTLTGCGALTENEAQSTTCGIPYNTPSNEENTYPQSTTGNITGIFDMSGGVWDAVMGNYNAVNASSGFSIYPASKYYDKYSTLDVNTACNNGICYGHTLSETSGWYGDTVNFVTSSNTWLYRGGAYPVTFEAGSFSYSSTVGAASDSLGCRSVLIPISEYSIMFDVDGGKVSDDFEITYTELVSYTSSGTNEFVVPSTGEYQLEVWGAQGGGKGGYGGYSKGIVTLEKDQSLYVVVGGQGALNKGGYNGGGKGQMYAGDVSPAAYGGGGATHIASTSGYLKNVNVSNLYIVAGAGGGGSEHDVTGGHGGGYIGNSGTGSCYKATGGTQLAGGTAGDTDAKNGGYGYGGDAADGNESDTYGAGGGGSGYYGGGGNSYQNDSDCAGGGAGGSGYIGNSLLNDKVMYCYNCKTSSEVDTLTYSMKNVSADPVANYAKKGSGAAKISLVNRKKQIIYGENYGNLPIPTKEGYIFDGWYTKPNGQGDKVTETTRVNIRDDHTLYAYWVSNKVNISYSLNGGNLTSSTTDGVNTYNWTAQDNLIYLNGEKLSSTFYAGETVDLINNNDTNYLNVTTDDGYSIVDGKEWICLSGCKSSNLTFDQSLLYTYGDFCTSSTCDIVLGVNIVDKYIVSYDANGGTNTPGNQTKFHGEPLILTSAKPTKSGYKFLGWSTVADDTSAIYVAGDEFNINSDVVLYAIWIPNKLYLYNDGDKYTSVTGGWSTLMPRGSYWSSGVVNDAGPSIAYVCYSASTYANYASYFTMNKINFSNYDKLKITASRSTSGSGYGYSYVAILDSRTLDDAARVIDSFGISGSGDFEYDISSLDGEYYVGVVSSAESGITVNLSWNNLYLN